VNYNLAKKGQEASWCQLIDFAFFSNLARICFGSIQMKKNPTTTTANTATLAITCLNSTPESDQINK
jgi:hypothetical protein